MTEEGGRDPLAGTAYRTMARLGAGGAGLVLEAEHKKLRKRVCVKILRDPSPDFIDRMQLEAQSLAALDGHPNVVLCTDFGETPGGQPFLVMERLYGRTLLEERDARGALPPLEAIDLVCQLLAGLEAVHALGVVHRDIKPGNVFVCNARGDGRRIVKLLDFGAAKLVDRDGDAPPVVEPRAMETAQGTIIGSPRYMAPEQIIAAASVDRRSDIYAAGAVLFSLLAGRGPFDDRSGHVGVVLGQLHSAAPPPSTLSTYPIPPALDRAVLRALAKQPADRFADARAFAVELERIARELSATLQTTQRLGASTRTAICEAPATVAERTMVSRAYVLERPGGHARRPLVWITLGGVLAGIVLGLYVLGVIR